MLTQTQSKHNASLIITGVVICLFAVFVFLAAFYVPGVDTTGLTDDAATMMKGMAQMVWWMTVALVVLPIMLLLIIIAGYLFITAERAPKPATTASPAPATPAAKPGLFGSKPATPAKVPENASPSEVLDLRYARGEINRDQYMSMKTDMKAPRL